MGPRPRPRPAAGPRTGPPAAGPEGTLVVRAQARHGDFRLDVALRVEPGRLVAVLGPNGAGKSTLLGAIAGTVPLEAGEVAVGERVLSRVAGPDEGAVGERVLSRVAGPDEGAVGERVQSRVAGPDDRASSVSGRGAWSTSSRRASTVSGRRVQVPVASRRVGLLGQDALVFPHLSVRENVAFGLRAAGVGAGEARAAADGWLERLGLPGFGDRRPDELSGGQRQRVAIARALAAGPDVLLLDEPFAQLDVRVAAGLRETLLDQLAATATPVVLVTHDALDALTLADHALVLHDGRVVEEGPPLELFSEPRTEFSAALAGLDLVRGRARGGTVHVDVEAGTGPRGSATLEVPLPADPTGAVAAGPPDGPVVLTFAPGDVRIVPGDAPVPPDGTGELVWLARVVDLERGPRGVRVRTSADVVADLTALEAAALALRPGDDVRLAVDAARARVRPA
ncbi:ABC transporter ATP-binding protein [Cellulomonas composti]|uniref:ABC transporter ATP-binding protein n=2 Tax=Cellulomonas composti TaxID=266130 RepID=A0A511JBR3_9CELL|nr:ABC transporter ATP-binding protein [Cellulomonas composti]